MNGHCLCKVKSECSGKSKVKVRRELGSKIVNKIINTGQNNSSQLFVHLLKDTLETRGTQQQVTKFLVCPSFKTPFPSHPCTGATPISGLLWGSEKRRGCGLSLCSRVAG